MNSLKIHTTNPFNILSRCFRYLMAPFFASEWKKSISEVQCTTPQKIKTSLIKIAIYYMLFSPLVAMPFYNTCIFHPFVAGDFQLAEIGGVKKQDVFFSGMGQNKLHGWLFEKPGAAKTVLVSHGNAGNLTHRTELVKMLLDCGASVFIYDYRGFGLSKGSPTVDGCCEDALAAYDYLRYTKGVPARAIVLYGESIGTGFTSQLASKRDCGSIILQSGFLSLPKIGKEKIPLLSVYPNQLFPFNPLDTLAYLKAKHPPVLLIHGTLDNIIPSKCSDELFKAASGEKYLVKLPKAGHNDIIPNMTFEALAALTRFCGTENI